MTVSTELRVRELTNISGASRRLSTRFRRSFGTSSVQKLVDNKKIRAFIFDEDGQLVERAAGPEARGREIFFLRADLELVEEPARPGRRWEKKEQAG